MIEILFIGVLFTGMLTEIISKKLEKYQQIIISYSIAIVLTLISTHILMELFSEQNLIFKEHHHSKGKLKNILTISAGIVSGILIFSF